MDGSYLFCWLVLGRPKVGMGFKGTHCGTVNKILFLQVVRPLLISLVRGCGLVNLDVHPQEDVAFDKNC